MGPSPSQRLRGRAEQCHQAEAGHGALDEPFSIERLEVGSNVGEANEATRHRRSVRMKEVIPWFPFPLQMIQGYVFGLPCEATVRMFTERTDLVSMRKASNVACGNVKLTCYRALAMHLTDMVLVWELRVSCNLSILWNSLRISS